MGKIRNVRKLLPRRIAVATSAMVAVVAGLGMAPAGAAEGIDVVSFNAASFDLEADIETQGEAKAGAEVKEKGATTLKTVLVE